MNVSIKYCLDHRRIKKDGTYPLVLRIVFRRKTINFSTPYYLYEKDWDPKNQKIKGRSHNIEITSGKFNIQLDNKLIQVRNYVSELEGDGRLFSISVSHFKEQVPAILNEKGINKIDVYSFIDQLIDQLERSNRHGTADSYKEVKRKLKNFHDEKELYFEQINYEFLESLESSHLEVGNGLGGLNVQMRALRAIYNKAIKSKVVSEKLYPFKAYKIKHSEASRDAMDPASFRKLINADLKKESAHYMAREMFLISFYLKGINWKDMCLLKKKQIIGNMQRIKYRRSKTGGQFDIKIHPKLKEIFEKYDVESKMADDYIFDFMDNDLKGRELTERIKNKRKRVNKYLKKIAEDLEIPRFTFYTARHTYATLLKFAGTPTAIIQEDMDHETEKQTQNYLKSLGIKETDKWSEKLFDNL